MRIIFLDFDGVLITLRSIRNKDMERKADQDCIAELNRIIDCTDAQIVVSSSWRIYGPARVREYLALWGVQGKIAGFTPDLSEQYSNLFLATTRTDEIARWLRDYPVIEDPITNYVILDDEPIDEPHCLFHIQTEFTEGLTENQAEDAIRLLVA